MKKVFAVLLLVVSLLGVSHANPLAPTEAFQLTAELNTKQLTLAWNIAPGYLLYRHSIAIQNEAAGQLRMGPVPLPTGLERHDAILGDYQVYQHHLRIQVPLQHTEAGEFRVQVNFQGCSDSGFCFPPQQRLLTLQISRFGAQVQSIETVSASSPLVNAAPKTSTSLVILLLSFFGVGILLSFTPCVLPMLPILSSIVIGKQRSVRHAFLLSLTYVLAMALAFALAGLAAGLLGAHIQAALQRPWIIITFIALFVALSLSLFGLYDLQLPSKWQSKLTAVNQKPKGGSYLGVALMGALSILIVSPCISAPLVAALAYIAQSGRTTLGGVLLFMMGLGMGVPLMLVGTLGAKVIPKSGAWMAKTKIMLGVLLLVTAIWLLYRLVPGNICLILWGLLAIVSSICLGVLNFKGYNRKTIVWFFVLWLWLALGLVYLAGGMLGNRDPMHPLHSRGQQTLSFVQITSVDDLQQALQKAHGHYVMVDFYAEWCVSCKIMEQNIFNQADVQQHLHHFILLQADVSANNQNDIALQTYLQVYAPPTIVFFDRRGHEISTARIVGEISKQQFIAHLNAIQRLDKETQPQ